MPVLELVPLTIDLLPAALDLDQRSLGGLWTRAGYLREIESPNSDLLGFRSQESGVPASNDPGVAGVSRQESAGRSQESADRSQQAEGTPPLPLSLCPPLSPSPPAPCPLSPCSPLLALGCVWAIAEEAHITLLAIDPTCQRQGLGQAMLYALLKSAHDRGLERATLEVRVSNVVAIALYEKFGFREAGRRKRYYQDTGEDGLILWRSGLHRPDFPGLLQQWNQEICDRLQKSGWQFLDFSLG